MASSERQRTDGTDTRDGTPVDGAAAGATPAGDGYSRIEQVAARTGLTKRTLRYYEEIGLLPPPTRTEGNYRLYSEADIVQLERIKRLRDLLGFSLKDIREIAQAEEEREQVRAAWQRETDPRARLAWLDRVETITRRQLQLVDEKLAGLQDMRAHVQARLERYDGHRAELQAQLGSAHRPDDGNDSGRAPE
ncbi:MAG TPA: MerR family transcriptional regulator [Ktedonobacterales bacterium]|jgi:DNA-binding transcriptional MerR regulator|nr:MerR family transcriptional regulator [Ktedonobacterales bacterium]